MEKLDDKIEIRCSTFQKNTMQGLANMFAKGNLSKFVRHCVLNTNREHIENNFESDGLRKGPPKKPS